MRTTALLAGALALTLTPALVPSESRAAGAKPAVKLERSVRYATAGGERLYLDIAVPPGDGPFPCVVMIHGGAWQFGGRGDFSLGKESNGQRVPSWLEVAAEKGYVAASVSYRLAPKHKFPAMAEDCRSAVRFLRANAKKFNIDPDRFAALGFSAGAHLALLVGMADQSAGFDVGDHLDVSGRVQCVVDFFGPTDIGLCAATPGIEDAYVVPVFGKAAKSDPAVYKKASPLTYASKDAPPTLILHGNLDWIVPIKHSEALQKCLTDAGAHVEMLTVPFGGHGGWTEREMEKPLATTYKFLDTHLKGKK